MLGGAPFPRREVEEVGTEGRTGQWSAQEESQLLFVHHPSGEPSEGQWEEIETLYMFEKLLEYWGQFPLSLDTAWKAWKPFVEGLHWGPEHPEWRGGR